MANLVPEVLEKLSSIFTYETRQKVRTVVGVKNEIENLISHLRDIKAELADAEKKEWKHPDVKQWLHKLREICYDMDDVLDVWSTEILRSQNNYALNPKRKVCSFLHYCCFSCGQDGMLSQNIAPTIKKLNDRVDAIVMEKDACGFNFEKSIEQQITPSIIDVSLLIRETQKESIIEMLLSERSQEIDPDVISMVGQEGIGKSALALQVFRDKRVIEHFEKRLIWVRVNPFDLSKIAKAIFESISSRSIQRGIGLDECLYRISFNIWGKKFFLVIDDMWEDGKKLEKLIKALGSASQGSKILVIARDEKFAIGEVFKLEPFSEEECWSLFTRAALFDDRASRERENLKAIGEKIVEKCKGLPLAILTVGSLLRSKKSKEEWESVLNSELWERKEGYKGHFKFAPLLVSYYDLPSKIRRCLSYCAIFPKDKELVTDELIKLWMAQGYLRATQSKEMEMIGKEYFDYLVSRSFFHDFVKDRKETIISFRMHDMICEFAQLLAKNECVSMEVEDIERAMKEMESSRREVRHLMLRFSKEVSFSHLFYGLDKLRSLLVEFESHSIWGSISFNKLTCLRSLKLRKFSDGKIANEIGTLIHLRHLDLSRNDRLVELPEKVCELYNLQTLDVSHCTSLGKLPSGIGKLINLRYLKNKDTKMLTFVPKGVERLTSLKELDEFVVSTGGGHDGEAAATLGDVGNLNQLRKYLKIRGLGNVRDANQACEAQLKSRKHLVSLLLNFDSRKETKGKDYDSKVIEGKDYNSKVIECLEPHPNLEYLEINDYRGMNLPRWMLLLTKLWKLCLSNCMNCEHLPLLGKLPCLEYLEIKQMQGVKKVGCEFLGDGIVEKDNREISAFPKLKELRFSDMKEWKEWEEWDIAAEAKGGTPTPRMTIMPSLVHLEIQDCPKLRALPTQILQTTLKELDFNNCPFLKIRYQRDGVDWLIISHFPIIQIDGQSQKIFEAGF